VFLTKSAAIWQEAAAPSKGRLRIDVGEAPGRCILFDRGGQEEQRTQDRSKLEEQAATKNFVPGSTGSSTVQVGDVSRCSSSWWGSEREPLKALPVLA
jgi:hypothetical protein